MNVVDSSAWLEYFADGPNAAFFAPAVVDPAQLIVPAITIYEVFKRVLQERGEADALQVIAVMVQGQVVDVTQSLAMSAAKISTDLGLPMADSLILATARAYNAVLWTQDADFRDLPGVKFIAKQ
jgi:predicted nucleic acid-binding protein